MSGKQKRLVASLKRRAARVSVAAAMGLKTPNEVAAELRVKSDGFLLTPEWRAVRAEAIKRYGLACGKCGAEQTARSRTNIDHIKPRKFFPELALDIDNLQPLCGKCNKRKGNGAAIDYRRPVVLSAQVVSA